MIKIIEIKIKPLENILTAIYETNGIKKIIKIEKESYQMMMKNNIMLGRTTIEEILIKMISMASISSEADVCTLK